MAAATAAQAASRQPAPPAAGAPWFKSQALGQAFDEHRPVDPPYGTSDQAPRAPEKSTAGGLLGSSRCLSALRRCGSRISLAACWAPAGTGSAGQGAPGPCTACPRGSTHDRLSRAPSQGSHWRLPRPLLGQPLAWSGRCAWGEAQPSCTATRQASMRGARSGGMAGPAVPATQPQHLALLPPPAEHLKMVTPLIRVKSVKKRTKRFQRHQSDRKIAVKVRGRPHGRPCPL